MCFCLLYNSPKTGTTMPKHSISKDKSFRSRRIFLPLYWQSLPPVLTCIDSKEHSHYYITQRPLYFDIWREISVFPPYRSQKTIVIANFEQVLWGSFCLNYPDLLFSWQFIEDTPVSQFWSISKFFLDTVKSSTNSDVLLVVFGLSGGIPRFKGTDKALYFSVSMKLNIEFIFFCGVHNIEKRSYTHYDSRKTG